MNGRTRDSVLRVIRENPSLFTGSMVGFILIFGIITVHDPSKWWIGLIAAVVAVVLFGVAVNGRVVIKCVVSIVVLLLSIAGASILGSYVVYSPFFSVTWPVYQIAVFCIALAFSYIAHSGKGRWNYLSVMTFLQFVITSALVTFKFEPYLSVVAGGVASLFLYIVVYLFNSKTRVPKNMPTPAFTVDFMNTILKGAELSGDTVRVVPAKGGIGSHLIVYKDKAVILYPIFMDSAFGSIGKRRISLGYHGRSINPWLANLSYSTSPAWKAKNASPTLVLVDMERANGNDSKIIGVSIPDSKKCSVVGIVPMLKKSDEKSVKLFLDSVFDLVDNLTTELTDKKKNALGKVGFSTDEIAEIKKAERKHHTESTEKDKAVISASEPESGVEDGSASADV